MDPHLDPRATEHRLTFGIDGRGDSQGRASPGTVSLPPVTGVIERAAAGNAQAMLYALIGKDAFGLTLGDRDRLLAALYGQLYGWDILADARCGACKARFELRFSLKALLEARRPDGSASGMPFAVAVGDARLRLPLVRDLDGDAADLIARLVLDGDPPDLILAEAALEAADPALELDLSGTCPECDHVQAVPFSMAHFLGAALLRDNGFLMREVHLLARTYGWSLESILGLTRAERQDFVRLILADQGDRPGVRRVS